MRLPKLGDEVKCRVTGVKGIVTAISKHLAGCDRIAVQSPIKDDKVPDPFWTDITLVDVIRENAVEPVSEPDSAQTQFKQGPGGDPHLIPKFNDPRI